MTSARTSVTLPEQLRAALDIRRRPGLVTPAELETTLSRIPFFRRTSVSGVQQSVTKRPSGDVRNVGPSGGNRSSGNTPLPSFRCGPSTSSPKGWNGRSGGSGSGSSSSSTATLPQGSTGNRFMALSTNAGNSVPDGWRSTTETHTRDADGFETWSNHRRGGKRSGGGSTSGPAVASIHSHDVLKTQSGISESKPGVHHESQAVSNAWKSSRYQSVETKIANESIEDRIMGKIRAKINKIGESTYDATKAFMQQILDSGETGFLEEFMQWVFQKAAMETAFCGLYARLLHDLADEFGHLRTEMQARFRNYTRIFVEAKQAPDVGTADYQAFVEAQSQKKFRRGYSQFVAELAKLSEINPDDFRLLVESIVTSIQTSVVHEDNKVLCEELVDCLSTMCLACGRSILRGASWMNVCMSELEKVVKQPRADIPGLTNKAMFGLMNIQDAHKAGWRK